jgi:Holliday junction resolvase
MTPAEIGSHGEKHVTAYLGSKGFSCYRNTQLPGSTDIEATRTDAFGNVTQGLLVQVKTAEHPNHPSCLSSEECSGIIARAKRKGWEAWLAQIQIDQLGGLVGAIAWTKLN